MGLKCWRAVSLEAYCEHGALLPYANLKKACATPVFASLHQSASSAANRQESEPGAGAGSFLHLPARSTVRLRAIKSDKGDGGN